MKWNLKKMLPAAAASLVAFTSLVNADDMQMRNLENRVTALEQKKGANGMINPAANPPTRDATGLFITAEALYWKARETGLGYAIESDDDVTSHVNGDMRRPKTRYDWGFKVGLGYAMPHDGWDLYANYTWFNSKKRHCDDDCDDCCSQCGTELFFPTFYAPCQGTNLCPSVTDACGKWKLHLQMLDLELGREFFVSKWLTLRPFVGGRGVWINQKYDIEYSGQPSGVETPFIAAGTEQEFDLKNRYRAGGLRAGLDTQWYFARDWSFYAEMAINIVLGQFRVKENADVETTATGAETNILHLEDKFIACRPIADLGLGISWDHGFADDAVHFGINFGWEQHYFWGQNQFDRFVDTQLSGAYVTNQGDLGVSGWVLGARLDF